MLVSDVLAICREWNMPATVHNNELFVGFGNHVYYMPTEPHFLYPSQRFVNPMVLNRCMVRLREIAEAQAKARDKERKLHNDLAEDPAGLCPARCDTERYWGHDYENGICGYCGRVEE